MQAKAAYDEIYGLRPFSGQRAPELPYPDFSKVNVNRVAIALDWDARMQCGDPISVVLMFHKDVQTSSLAQRCARYQKKWPRLPVTLI